MLKRTVTIIFALMLTVSMLAVPQASAAGTTTSGNDSSAFTLRASRSGNTVKLSWDKYSGAKWYYLYYVNEDNSTALICRTARTSFTDTDKSTDAGKTVKIDNNSNYKYVVKAANEEQQEIGSSNSAEVLGAQYAAPSRVKLKASRSGNTITLSWNKCTRADYYLLYYVNSKGKPYKTICKTSKTAFTDTDKSSDCGHSVKIRSDRDYTYMVIARNATDRGNFDSKAKVTVKKLGYARLMSLAKSKLGSRYVSGGKGPNSFDCSGYVWYCYSKSNCSTVKFSRSSAAGIYSALRKYNVGRNINNAKPGDILMFTHGGSTIDHTGIYCGRGYMYHASSSSTGVIKSPVYQGSRRVAAIIRLPGVN